jgi:hypothetical protein
MATRTVRLDDESERMLMEICRARELSVSQALKAGLHAACSQLKAKPSAPPPYEIYRRIDLGPGGYARAPARDAQRAIRRVLHERRAR